jgi:uncharacterized membrane protein YjfL (UPF0719 family)
MQIQKLQDSELFRKMNITSLLAQNKILNKLSYRLFSSLEHVTKSIFFIFFSSLALLINFAIYLIIEHYLSDEQYSKKKPRFFIVLNVNQNQSNGFILEKITGCIIMEL